MTVVSYEDWQCGDERTYSADGVRSTSSGLLAREVRDRRAREVRGSETVSYIHPSSSVSKFLVHMSTRKAEEMEIRKNADRSKCYQKLGKRLLR